VCVSPEHSSLSDTLAGYPVASAVSGFNLCLSVLETGDTLKIAIIFCQWIFLSEKNLFFCVSASETRWCPVANFVSTQVAWPSLEVVPTGPGIGSSLSQLRTKSTLVRLS